VVLTLRTTELSEKNADIKLSIFTYRYLVYSLFRLLLYEYPLFPSIHPTFIKTEASWKVMPCTAVDMYKRFAGKLSFSRAAFHLQVFVRIVCV
jgi:hypothetical protein